MAKSNRKPTEKDADTGADAALVVLSENAVKLKAQVARAIAKDERFRAYGKELREAFLRNISKSAPSVSAQDALVIAGFFEGAVVNTAALNYMLAYREFLEGLADVLKDVRWTHCTNCGIFAVWRGETECKKCEGAIEWWPAEVEEKRPFAKVVKRIAKKVAKAEEEKEATE